MVADLGLDPGVLDQPWSELSVSPHTCCCTACQFDPLRLGPPNHMNYNRLQCQKGRPRGNLEALVQNLGLDPGLLDQPWSELSVSSTRNVCVLSNMLRCSLWLSDLLHLRSSEDFIILL
jgi:hypothetical protein